MKTVIFNNAILNNYVKIEEIRDSILPPISAERTDNVNNRGSKFKRSKLEEKIIEIDIRMIDELEDKKIQLTNILYTEELAKLEFESYYYMATLDGTTDFEKFLYTGFATLTFLATDPIKFGTTKTISIVDNATLILQCTYKTLPKFVFEILSDVNKIRINNTTAAAGKYVEVNHNFIIGDKVEIDFSDKWKVRKNGIVIAEDVAIESDFFSLNVGENKISANIPCTLEYIERWL